MMSLRGMCAALILVYLLMAVYTIIEVAEFEFHKHGTAVVRSLEWARGRL